MEPSQIDLLNLGVEELQALMQEWGEPAFRGKQIYVQLHVKRAATVEEMTDLPKALRERLANETRIGGLDLVKVFEGDGGITRKALFKLADGVTVEAVLMVYPGRATVCVSSQAGCPMGCTFCATAKLGFLHDLTPGQMVQQVLWASRELDAIREQLNEKAVRRHRVTHENFPSSLSNVVFMGMGEPFNNYDNWWQSVLRLHDPKGFNMGARSFTVSTVGLVPGIRQLTEAELPINLAISLHASDDERRGSMMPVNKKYPIADLLDAVRDYTEKTRRRVSFEYVLLNGENDSPEEAERLASLLRDGKPMLCHVNLIPWNPVAGTNLARSTRDRINTFRDVLEDRGVPCTIRIQRGMDINAACGQLAGDFQAADV